jgi:hypothetical protein
VIEKKELLQKFRQLLNEEERQLADLRIQGYSWPEVAAQLGGTPDARRVQLDRAIERVVRQMGLDEAP